jgi:hypothetical protein
MAAIMMECLKIIYLKAQGNFFGQMDLNIQGNGKVDYKKELVSKYIKMADN